MKQIECYLGKKFFKGNNLSDARTHLKNHLREHVTFERNILRKEMLENERKIYNDSMEQERKNMLNNFKMGRFLISFGLFLNFLLIFPIEKG